MNLLLLFCVLAEDGVMRCRREVTANGAVVTVTETVDGRGLDGKVTKLASSEDHACALTARGRLYCWGDNTAGKLGLGGVAVWQPPSEDGDWKVARATPGIPFPTKPVSEKRFIAVSVRGNGSAALSDEATDNLYGWGRLATIEGLEENAVAFAKASATTPRRVDSSAVPERRFDGVVSSGIGGFAWSASNAVYRWDYSARLVGTVPKEAPIIALEPSGASVCATTTRGRFCEKNGAFVLSAPERRRESTGR